MDKKEIMIEKAIVNFNNGYNCSESIFKAYVDTEDLDPTLVALSSGFGGGIGGFGYNTCGALIGGCLAMSYRYGRKDILANNTAEEKKTELKENVYPVFKAISEEFNQKFDSTICKEMCGHFEDFHSEERKKFCKDVIKKSATIISQKIYE